MSLDQLTALVSGLGGLACLIERAKRGPDLLTRFEFDGEAVQAPVGTLVFVSPDVTRTAFAEEPGTTIIALGGTPEKAYKPGGFESRSTAAESADLEEGSRAGQSPA